LFKEPIRKAKEKASISLSEWQRFQEEAVTLEEAFDFKEKAIRVVRVYKEEECGPDAKFKIPEEIQISV